MAALWRVARCAATPEWLCREIVRRQRTEPRRPPAVITPAKSTCRRDQMGKGILLWLLGIPLPIIILLLLFWH
ncbi:hypothetical protein E5A74_00080 [Sphingomonas naasensis]|uniref:Uncharacterized protein n=1 Tax=Sphingomonas naasensis TaxID=1344951 RepID=A0A4S1WTJ1_9SPHN|nr:hypothetical protein E5A74_00080 [Sphingomonas naasensis]